MHITFEDMNLLLTQKVDSDTRAQLTDHILDCPSCAKRFKAMNALAHEMDQAPKKPIPLRYVIGVAAVMIMSISPYLTRQDTNAAPTMIASLDTANQQAASFAILDRIEQVNYSQAVSEWGEKNDVSTLIRLRNRQH